MAKNNSTEQDKHAKENKSKQREYGMNQNMDKKLDGPNRPAE